MMVFKQSDYQWKPYFDIRVQRDELFFIYFYKWIITNSDNPRGLTPEYLKAPIGKDK